MVITDVDTGYTSREANGRFQVTLAKRPASEPQPASNLACRLPVQFELQCFRDRIRARIASRQIDRQYRQN